MLVGWKLLYLRNLEHLLVDLLQGVDTLLELDVVRWKLGLGAAVSYAPTSKMAVVAMVCYNEPYPQFGQAAP